VRFLTGSVFSPIKKVLVDEFGLGHEESPEVNFKKWSKTRHGAPPLKIHKVR